MALAAVTSQRELARVAALSYEARRLRVSLAFSGGGLTAESDRTAWDAVKLSGNGYSDFVQTLLTGAWNGSTTRHELPAVNAIFTGAGAGFTATHFYAVLGVLNTRTITNVALTANVATITTATVHGFLAGATVQISGLTNSVFNGTYTISTVASSTFTYARVNANIASVADSGVAQVATEDTNIMQLGTFTPSEVWAAGQTKTIQIPISVDD